jgi:serine/threonine protein kinase
MYRGNQNDVWSLGILLTKIIDIPHPYINFDVDTESKAKTKLIEGKADFHFLPHHQGGGKAASLICQMLEPDPRQRITVSPKASWFTDSADSRDP